MKRDFRLLIQRLLFFHVRPAHLLLLFFFRVSFMCKYAPTAVAAVMFLDPICFCLHYPKLTKQFVYHRADPGSTSHMIRTDVNVNWTIQRGFPWARISLFTEQIPCVPTAVFLSENDALGE